MKHIALVINTDEINYNKALDMEDFVVYVREHYGTNPKFVVGSDRPSVMVMSSVILNPQDADRVGRVHGILSSLPVTNFTQDGVALVAENMAEIVPEDMLPDALELIESVIWSYEDDTFHVTFKDAVCVTKEWRIQD